MPGGRSAAPRLARVLAAATVLLLAAAVAPSGAAAQANPGRQSITNVEQSLVLTIKGNITNWAEFAAANNITGWGDDPAIPPCLWTGITCTANAVLSSVALQCPTCVVKAKGRLSADVAQLRTLSVLNMQQNSLSGPLPAEWGAAGAFPGLLNLVLQQNQLTGSLPDGWADPGAMPSLTLLSLGFNRLTGTLPADMALPSLLILRVQGNRLAGTLPAAWGSNASLPQLRVAALHENRLRGSIPGDWADAGVMRSLEELYLQENQLTGGLPAEWGSYEKEGLPQLRVLNLSSNPGLGGTLPYQWSRQDAFQSLKTLALSNTGLQGTLPPSWDCQDNTRCGLASLQTLWLDGNNLSGPVPPSWSTLNTLQTVFVRPGNPLLCLPRQADFPFRLCDASSGVECNSEAQLDTCEALFPGTVVPGAEPSALPAAVDSADGGGVNDATAAIAGSSDGNGGGGGGTPVGAIVGGVVGGVAAAMATLAALLLVRRRRRRRHEEQQQQRLRQQQQLAAEEEERKRREQRELPFYGVEALPPPEDDHPASRSGTKPPPPPPAPPPALPPGGAPSTPLQQPPAEALPRAASTDNVVLLASPFAALAAELEPPGSPPAGASGMPRNRSSTSLGSFFSRLMGTAGGGGDSGNGNGSGTAAAAAAAEADAALDAEIDRHLSIELAALEGGHRSRSTTPQRPGLHQHLPPPHEPGSGGTAAVRLSGSSTAGSSSTLSGPAGGSLAGLGLGLSPASRTASKALLWEDSIPLSDWQITPDEIEIARRPGGTEWELGTGGFGKVYKALRHGAQPVAVKVLTAMGEASQQYQGQEDFKREIAILRACRDPNIVAFLGASLQPDRTMLVTEYCDGGNLTRNLMAGRVNWYKRGKKVALDVARGLTYLHSRRIVHFDLKSPNILLARDGTAKISDVGMAKIMAREYSGITGNVGTLAWAAPEMLLGARCTEKADIYSYGVVLWEIVTGQTPIRGQLRDVRVPEECPGEVRELILDCLATNPRKRPSAVEIVERLRALPDYSPPPGSVAHQQQQQQRQRQHRAPLPPGRGAPGRGGGRGGGAAAAELAPAVATHAARAAEGQGTQQAEARSSEESAVSFGTTVGGGTVPSTGQSAEELAAAAALATAYASPVPGTPAAARLAAAGRGVFAGGGSGPVPVAPRRAGSMLLGSALPQPHTLLQEQQLQRQRQAGMGRASSSPPGSSGLPEAPPLLPAPPLLATPPAALPRPPPHPAAHRGSAARAAPIGRPPPLHVQRQGSLDDPARQLAELQGTLPQLTFLRRSPSPSTAQRQGSASSWDGAAQGQQQQEGNAAAAGRPPASLVSQLAGLQSTLRSMAGAPAPTRQQSQDQQQHQEQQQALSNHLGSRQQLEPPASLSPQQQQQQQQQPEESEEGAAQQAQQPLPPSEQQQQQQQHEEPLSPQQQQGQQQEQQGQQQEGGEEEDWLQFRLSDGQLYNQHQQHAEEQRTLATQQQQEQHHLTRQQARQQQDLAQQQWREQEQLGQQQRQERRQLDQRQEEQQQELEQQLSQGTTGTTPREGQQPAGGMSQPASGQAAAVHMPQPASGQAVEQAAKQQQAAEGPPPPPFAAVSDYLQRAAAHAAASPRLISPFAPAAGAAQPFPAAFAAQEGVPPAAQAAAAAAAAAAGHATEGPLAQQPGKQNDDNSGAPLLPAAHSQSHQRSASLASPFDNY